MKYLNSSIGYILENTKIFQIYFEKDSAFPVLIKCYSEFIADKDSVKPAKGSFIHYLKYKDLKGHSNLIVSLKKAIKNRESGVTSYICKCNAVPTDNPDAPYLYRSCHTKHIQLTYVYDKTPLVTETERIERLKMKKRDYKNGPMTLYKLLKTKELNPELKDIHFSLIPVSIDSFSYHGITNAGIHIQNDNQNLFKNLTHSFGHPDFKSNNQNANPFLSEAYVYENGIRTNSDYIDFSSVYYYRNYKDVRENIDGHLMRYMAFKKNNPKSSPSEGSEIIVNTLINESLALLINNIATGLWKPEALCGAGIVVCMKELLMRTESLKNIQFNPLKMKSVLIRLNHVIRNIDSNLQTGKLMMVLRNYWKQYTQKDVTIYPKTYTYSELKALKKDAKPEEYKNKEEYKKLKEANKAFMLEYKRQHNMKSNHTKGFKIKQEEKSAKVIELVVKEQKSYNAVSKELKIGKATIVRIMKEYAEKKDSIELKDSVDLLSLDTYTNDEMTWEEQNALMRNGITYKYLESEPKHYKIYNKQCSTTEYRKSKNLRLSHNMTYDDELKIYQSCKGAIDYALNVIEHNLNKPFFLLDI